ncbi:MAG: cysteine desulfurase [Eubacterium sp.]|nr:cysteine desulfurase [Eubacterium sp.]MCM1237948.1 cysteine desulfurase [Lachnospiraceae bacterium]
MIYADNAATTKMDNDAFEAMSFFLTESYGNASQPYSFSSAPKKALKEARTIIARCIGADPYEIYFTSCGTESDNWALKMGAGATGEVITSVIEHHAILNACKTLERCGRIVKYVPVSSEGVVDMAVLADVISSNTKLVSVMYANNEVGSIQPIEAIAKIAHDAGAYFHTDAVQAVGHVKIDVHKIGIDFLSASAHKFNGPKGIGFLYISKGIDINPFIDGGQQEFGKRAGTENIAAIVAMAIALQNNVNQIETNAKKLNVLEDRLLSRLDAAGVDYIRNGSTAHIPGNVNISFANREGEVLLHRLDLKGVCVSTGSACDSVNTKISHVIKAIGVPDKYSEGTIRISLGKGNTEQEVDYIADALIEIIK